MSKPLGLGSPCRFLLCSKVNEPAARRPGFCLLVLLLLSHSCAFAQQRLAMIIDADTANEVDDLYAIARALAEPTFDLLGITSAQFHISPLASDTSAEESYWINRDLVRLMARMDVPVLRGSNQPMQKPGEPASSAASDFIVQMAHQQPSSEPLQIVVLGSCTNVAAAILQDPTIISKITVHYIGFWHDPSTNHYNLREFNSGNDTLAVAALLNAVGLDLDVMSATTCQHLIFSKEETIQELRGQGSAEDYLIDRWNSYDRWFSDLDPQKERWIMWDVAIIEALAHPELATKRAFVSPPNYRQREIEIYTDIDVSAMKADFWSALSRTRALRD